MFVAKLPRVTTALVLLAACDQLLPYNPSSPGRLDARPDGPEDAGLADVWGDTALPDLSAEASMPPPSLQCDTPAVLDAGGKRLWQPAISANGLRLYAFGFNELYYSERPNLDASFGAWTVFSATGIALDQISFFESWAVGSNRADEGGLLLCQAKNNAIDFATCKDLQINGLDSPRPRLTSPSVTATPKGWLMAFAVLPPNATTTDVYIARPSDADDLFQPWHASKASVNGADQSKDNPALALGGRVMVYEAPSETDGSQDLWIATRANQEATLTKGNPLSSVNSSNTEGSPELFEVPDGSRVELFFYRRDVANNFEILYSSCAIR